VIKFVSGSDEHGVPITIRAKEGKYYRKKIVVDKYHAIIKDKFSNKWHLLDTHSRTSNEVHHKTVSGFFYNII